MGMAAIHVFPIAAFAHPMHSEAIERPCQIHKRDDSAPPIIGQCSFFIAAGYLIFELKTVQGREVAGSQAISGAINLTQSTGSIFQTDVGPLANGAVALAERSPQVVHMEPGTLAAWDNGYALEVSGAAAKADDSAVPMKRQNSEAVSEVIATYLELGFVHIIPRGFDHILFVIGLFLLSPKLSALLWQVSAFTIAHTLTLALGATGIVSISPNVVEPLIALSILWVAVENLVTDKLHWWRTGVVFCFGLLHGLGFAGVLREIGFSGGQFVAALLAFNVGVEFGQLTVIALCFLAVGWAMQRPDYHRHVVIPASCTIAVIAVYWFLQRTGVA